MRRVRAISWTGLLFEFVAIACPFADWFAGLPLQSGSPAPGSSHPAPSPIPEPEPHSLPTTSWPPKLCALDQHYLTQRAELQRTGHTPGLAA
jgi:hypothetical protein